MNSKLQSSRRARRAGGGEGCGGGAGGTAPAALTEELRAVFAQSRESVRHEAADGIKRLEAWLASVDRRINVMDGRWATVSAAAGELPPALLLPACAVFSAVLVVVGEPIFLAPVMDGFGISEFYEQRCLAAVIVLVASGAFEISKKLFQRLSRGESVKRDGASPEAPKRVWAERAVLTVFVALTLLSLAFVCVLGWWRAEEMAFAARATGGAMQNDEWSRFMGDNLPLTRALVVLFALMLPLFVAFAFEWGADKLRLAVEWRRVRRAVERLPRERERAAKRLEAALEKRDCRLKSLDEQQAEWTQSYAQTHEVGERVGAWRLPLWQVAFRIAAVTLLFAAVCFVADLLISSAFGSDWFAAERYVIALFVTLGAGGVFAFPAPLAGGGPAPAPRFRRGAGP